MHYKLGQPRGSPTSTILLLLHFSGLDSYTAVCVKKKSKSNTNYQPSVSLSFAVFPSAKQQIVGPKMVEQWIDG